MYDSLHFAINNISTIVIILYSLFFFSALMLRFSSGDYYDKLPEEDSDISLARKRGEKLAFIVSGFLDQPDRAMQHIELQDYNMIAIANDVFGFKIDQYRDIIDKYSEEGDIAIGISVGAKAVVESDIGKQILINPCVHPLALKGKYFWLAKIFAPLLQLVSWILGWLSFIPFISANDSHFSLAFFADQLWEIGYGWPIPSKEADIDIVISSEDEFLNNQVIIEDFEEEAPDNSTIIRINTKHARIGDKKDAPKYQNAINYLLK